MNGYLVKLNTTDVTGFLKAPSGYEVHRAKLWTDAGRNMSGNLRSTFLGIFPKITLDVRAGLSNDELQPLINILDNTQITVEWWDVVTQGYKSGTFYAGDFTYSMHRKNGQEFYDTFKVSLISFNKMS